VLASLVDQSLVQRVDGPRGATRFGMLETVREYGLERLAASGEEPAVRDVHVSWCVAFAERAEPELAGPDHVVWFEQVEAEIGNIRAAHAWLAERGDIEHSLHLAATLSWFWQAAGYFQEGRDLFARLLADPRAAAAPAAFARVLGSAASLEAHLGNHDQAETYVIRALTIFRTLGDRRGEMGTLRTLGSIVIDCDDLARAETLLRQIVTEGPAVGAAWEAISAEHLLGIVAFTRGHYTAAMGHAETARAKWQARGDLGHAGMAQVVLALAAFATSDLERATTLGRDLLAQLGDVEDDGMTSACFDLAAGLALRNGEAERAAWLLGAADAMLARIGTPRRPGIQRWLDDLADATRRALGETRFAAAWATGAETSVAAATTEAFAIFDLAAVTRSPGMATGRVLTPRQGEVLRLLVEGLSDKEIAATLGIARPTVSNHVSAIRGALGVASRAGAAALAVRDHLI
jgi:non-specific serine/threonine protein kinase